MATLPLTIPDLVCVDDLDPYGRETTSDLETLFQDIYHLLVELPGSNPDDPDRGVGVSLYLNGTSDKLASLPGTVETQLSRDDRIDHVDANVVQNANSTWKLAIQIGVDGSIIPLEYGWQDGNFTNLTGGV